MLNNIRFVVDANIIASASLHRTSRLRKVLTKIIKENTLLISEEVVKELKDVLGRAKFDQYISKKKRKIFLRHLIKACYVVEVTSNIDECRDKKDNKYLELAVDGNVEYIVSEDQDLLVMNPFRNVKIISKDEFIRTFGDE